MSARVDSVDPVVYLVYPRGLTGLLQFFVRGDSRHVSRVTPAPSPAADPALPSRVRSKEGTMAHQEMMIAWLNDAYAMENSLIHTLEQRIKEAKDHPHIRARDEQHLDETRRHAELVKGCVERLGGKTSALKAGMSSVMGVVQGMSTALAKDTLVKNCLADYSAEQLEVASYTALIAGAQALGDQETARVCQLILQEDEAMAQWIMQNLPAVVQQTLMEQAAAHAR
jgi:ferritin-like metal-binding protein YciE